MAAPNRARMGPHTKEAIVPTPLEILLDPVSLSVLGMYALLMALEAAAPGRPLPRVAGWRARAGLSFVGYFYLSSYLPLWLEPWLSPHTLFDLSSFGAGWGAVVGLLVYEFGGYFWHRAMHASELLWRYVHQMHHSAERLDAASAFYFSPLDMTGWTLVSSLSLGLVLGLDPQATTYTLFAVTFMGIFQHTNLRTPRWLGYLVQRPESHTVHHGRGVHAHNYADLPLLDLVFGTFVNPKGFEHPTGFYPGASARVGAMLLGRDVSKASLEASEPRPSDGTAERLSHA